MLAIISAAKFLMLQALEYLWFTSSRLKSSWLSQFPKSGHSTASLKSLPVAPFSPGEHLRSTTPYANYHLFFFLIYLYSINQYIVHHCFRCNVQRFISCVWRPVLPSWPPYDFPSSYCFTPHLCSAMLASLHSKHVLPWIRTWLSLCLKWMLSWNVTLSERLS